MGETMYNLFRKYSHSTVFQDIKSSVLFCMLFIYQLKFWSEISGSNRIDFHNKKHPLQNQKCYIIFARWLPPWECRRRIRNLTIQVIFHIHVSMLKDRVIEFWLDYEVFMYIWVQIWDIMWEWIIFEIFSSKH